MNVVQQQDALAARLNTADGASRNLAILDAGPVVRHEVRAPSHIAMGREVLLDRLLAQQTGYPKERRHPLRVADVGVLHGADAGMLVGIDYECAADPQRARWALLGICRAQQN